MSATPAPGYRFVQWSGGFGYEQFRSDPEDLGGWTPISGYSAMAFESLEEAVEQANNFALRTAPPFPLLFCFRILMFRLG